MNLRNAFSVAIVSAVLAIASSASAVTIEVSSAPTDGVAGFTTYTLTAIADDPTSNFIGFNFADPLGFFGPLGQVNPIGMDTVFNDLNGFFGDTPVDNDSQFRVTSTDGLAVNPSEANDHLQAAFNFTGGNNAGNSWDFVQLSIPDDGEGTVQYDGFLVLQDGSGGNFEERVSGQVGGIPEPASIVLIGMALVGLVGLRRRS